MATVYVRAGKDQILEVIRNLPRAVAGNLPGAASAAEGFLIRIGMAALGNIKRAFIVKARGGTDEAGLKWPKLQPATIAYSRRHPGVPPKSKRAPFAPSWMLTEKQRKRWWAIFRGEGGTKPEGAAYHRGGGGGWAAARAWRQLKAEGAQTLIGVYGGTEVEILRDTGLLLNSLSPGVPGDVPNQVFRTGKGEVIVGTNRAHADKHHKGGTKLPQRRLWPAPEDWPASWWGDIIETARDGLIEIAQFLMRRSG